MIICIYSTELIEIRMILILESIILEVEKYIKKIRNNYQNNKYKKNMYMDDNFFLLPHFFIL